jgi:hypothetical protein
LQKRILLILLLIAATVAGNRLSAQTYPVQAGLMLQPPYSVYLSDYAMAGTDKLSIQLLLQDMTKPQLPVRLRLTITNQQGIIIRTRPGYMPSPLTLEGGIPLRLTGAELAPYLAAENLDISGINRTAFVRGGQALPEGLYQVCVEVYEYYRNERISNQACAMAWMILNEPPMLNLPLSQEKLRATEPQNLVFQWTPRHTGSPNAAFSTEYEFSLVEIWPENRNPNDAILSTAPIYQTTIRNSMLVYGPAEPPLQPGRRYAWRVQAKSMSGGEELNLFKNSGYSEVFSFKYGDECLQAYEVKAEALSNGRLKLGWEAQNNHTTFTVRYREKGEENTRWYEKESYKNEFVLVDLKHSTEYEYSVLGQCGSVPGEYTPIASITTQAYEEPAYACGLPLEPVNLDEVTLLASLQAGDIIQAGDFNVQLASVSGSGGRFSGRGVVVVPFMNKAKVNVEFEAVQVDENYRMVGGFMNLTGAKLEVVPAEVMQMMDKLTETLNKIDAGLDQAEEVVEAIDEALEKAKEVYEEMKEYLPDDVKEEIESAEAAVKVARDKIQNAATPEEKAEAQAELKESKQKLKDGIKKGLEYYAEAIQDLIKIIRDALREMKQESQEMADKKEEVLAKEQELNEKIDTRSDAGAYEVPKENSIISSAVEESRVLKASEVEVGTFEYELLQYYDFSKKVERALYTIALANLFQDDSRLQELGNIVESGGQNLLKNIAVKMKEGESEEKIKSFVKEKIYNLIDQIR